ncbi:MAG: hypothetical protein V5A55_11560 [Halovenus sp.]
MSSSPITDPETLLGTLGDVSLSLLIVRPVRFVAFWAAVILPFLHLPLLATGLESQAQTLAFIALVTLNVCALVVGQEYGSAQ